MKLFTFASGRNSLALLKARPEHAKAAGLIGYARYRTGQLRRPPGARRWSVSFPSVEDDLFPSATYPRQGPEADTSLFALKITGATLNRTFVTSLGATGLTVSMSEAKRLMLRAVYAGERQDQVGDEKSYLMTW